MRRRSEESKGIAVGVGRATILAFGQKEDEREKTVAKGMVRGGMKSFVYLFFFFFFLRC